MSDTPYRRGDHPGLELESAERRQGRRFVFIVPVSAESEELVDLRLINLSAEGAELLLPENFRVATGQTLSCHLPLPEGILGVDLTIQVVWLSESSPRRCGVVFVGLPSSERQVVEAYLDYLERDKTIFKFRKTMNVYLSQLDTLIRRLQDPQAMREEVAQRQKERYLH